MQYEAFCDEHDLRLDAKGCCPKCRDANGNPFPLDMQSIYLKPTAKVGRVIESAAGLFYCELNHVDSEW